VPTRQTVGWRVWTVGSGGGLRPDPRWGFDAGHRGGALPCRRADELDRLRTL